MPKFTIETTYDLPVYRQVTYDAPDAETALAMAMADDDWSGQKEDIESGHDTRLTGAWVGEEAYRGDHVTIPAELGSSNILAETALRQSYAAIESLLEQIGQMRGMFADEDGAIQNAVNDGDAAIEDIAKALARLA